MSDESLPTERRSTLGGIEIAAEGKGGMLLPGTLSDAVRFAEVMCKADLALPKHLRGNAGACLAITLQALRWEMDPFMVANKTYEVSQRLAYEAQLVAAVVLTRAPIVGRPEYTYTGEAPTRRCKVTIQMKGGQSLEYETPMSKDIKVQNSPLWKADLDQQLGYFAIRSWARRHTPEVLLGVYTPDEAAEMRDITPRKSGIAEALTAGKQGSVGGFSPESVEEALEAVFDDVAQPDPVEVTSEPESEPVVEAETQVKDPLQSLEMDMDAATDEQRLTWVSLLKAFALREKTPQTLMSLWRAQFERIGRLKVLHQGAYDELEAWWESRIKKLRASEK